MNRENINKVSELIEKAIDYHVSQILTHEYEFHSADFIQYHRSDIDALKDLTAVLGGLKNIEFLSANTDAQAAISQALSGVDMSNMDFSKVADIMNKMGG